MLYLPPGVTVAMLEETSLPIVIVEGEYKALASWRLATHETEYPRFLPVAVSGVWNWRGTVGKAAVPDGGRRSVKLIAWADVFSRVCHGGRMGELPLVGVVARPLLSGGGATGNPCVYGICSNLQVIWRLRCF